MTCEVMASQQEKIPQENVNSSHQEHQLQNDKAPVSPATSSGDVLDVVTREDQPPVSPQKACKSSSKPHSRSSSNSNMSHSQNTDSLATEAPTVVSDSESISDSSVTTLACFFPNHRALDGEYPRRVVKYANRRLSKAKLVPCNRSLQMPQLRHSQIQLNRLLGEGSFSSVFSVSKICRSNYDSNKLPDSEELVVKVLRKKILNNPAMLAACAADLVKEGLLLARCNHPNILSIHGWGKDGVEAFRSGRHDSFFLVIGKLETTLSDKLKVWRQYKADHHTKLWNKVFPKSQIVTEKMASFRERLQILKDLAKAVVYLHSQNILHRDLKPDNIGFAPDGTLKIFDFDVARLLPIGRSASLNHTHSDSDSQRIFQMTRRVGSPRYMSPECARGDPYNAKADVYTVSLLVHELYCLEKPYEEVPAELHDEMIFYQGARPPLTKTWPAPLKRLLSLSWSEYLADRPTMEEFLAQWSVLMPILVADKERKYHKFAWLKNSKSKAKMPVSASEEDDATVAARNTRVSTKMDKNHKNVPLFLSASSRTEAGLSGKSRSTSNWEMSARTTLSSCAEQDS